MTVLMGTLAWANYLDARNDEMICSLKREGNTAHPAANQLVLAMANVPSCRVSKINGRR
jgi:hypothetical protein